MWLDRTEDSLHLLVNGNKQTDMFSTCLWNSAQNEVNCLLLHKTSDVVAIRHKWGENLKTISNLSIQVLLLLLKLHGRHPINPSTLIDVQLLDDPGTNVDQTMQRIDCGEQVCIVIGFPHLTLDGSL